MNQTENELTDFPVETHIAAANPYNHPVPSTLARQINTLSRVVMLSEIPKGAKALDMGCGWGLSSEILAYCGYEVTAVDINPHFVRLVDERAARLKLPIVGVQSNFDDFQTTERFDLILFYECLHHALKPWELLEKMTRFLAPDGKIIMAGEPVQSLWWKHWGLRFDALSMYCMKKFGWFESGFSVEFLHSMLARQHFSLIADGPPEDPIYVARSLGAFKPSEIATFCDPDEWHFGAEFVVSKGGSCHMSFPHTFDATSLEITIHNFKNAPIPLSIKAGSSLLVELVLQLGLNQVKVPLPSAKSGLRIQFNSEGWVPSEVFNSADTRRLSFHVSTLSFGEFKRLAAC